MRAPAKAPAHQEVGTATMPLPTGVMVRYTDAGGEHVVGSILEVPAAFRAKAVPVTGTVTVDKSSALEAAKSEASLQALKLEANALSAQRNVERALHDSGWTANIHLPSLGLGAGAMLVLTLGWSLVKRRPDRILRLVVMGMVCGGLAVGYLSWLRYSAGLGGLASPTTVIDDARRAASAAERSINDQQKRLEQIDRDSR